MSRSMAKNKNFLLSLKQSKAPDFTNISRGLLPTFLKSTLLEKSKISECPPEFDFEGEKVIIFDIIGLNGPKI
mgnify:CR=1 FL=1